LGEPWPVGKAKDSQILKQDFDDDKRSLKAIWKSI